MATSPAKISGDLASEMAKVNDLFNREVIGNRNFGAIDQIYTFDARILPPGAPMISGRDAIRDFWRGMAEALNPESVALRSVDVMPAGEGVLEIGEATITAQSEGKAVAMQVKYVVYWRQELGRWKWHVDIWNPNS